MPIIVLSWFLTFGAVLQQDDFVTTQSFQNYEYSTLAFLPAYVNKLGVNANIGKIWDIGVSTTTYAYQNPEFAFGFLPYRSDFIFRTSLNFGNVKFEIMHECDHPVVFFIGEQLNSYGKGYTEVTVTIKG